MHGHLFADWWTLLLLLKLVYFVDRVTSRGILVKSTILRSHRFFAKGLTVFTWCSHLSEPLAAAGSDLSVRLRLRLHYCSLHGTSAAAHLQPRCPPPRQRGTFGTVCFAGALYRAGDRLFAFARGCCRWRRGRSTLAKVLGNGRSPSFSTANF